MAKYKLYYAEMDTEDIPTFKFNRWVDLSEFLVNKFKDNPKNIIYLYSYGNDVENPILVTSNYWSIVEFIATTSGNYKQHIIHEYSSYEEAYRVALDMMEPHPLCYESGTDHFINPSLN